ncbi:hypothetical protein C5C31_13135 [Rathayibacter rathayi]|uniref:DUF2516 domain-containing protein n=1 Tax=Rathayibacter rathayi TaxID=33887 RepID=A0ABX5AAR7_RATRA|nr:hypothetical protein [Rathayibacter rathayi]MWV75891.1 hypothetical protein [Rathayibacter rathayi NCPPB 2980 = VKM Ac-1601]PPF23004.1 hypothetical protein C5C34_10135 [Rathayibacter rathayi]PPF44724.1 hypothetical protein C5C08_12870 [Rathayibacter rathayi]PPF77364.1 hypothetical protein C5C14_12545 [Rathayibacter rathayi]PPG11476.1 hypothetical protein C5C11_12555 [Rathayibacter rathayi]
MYDSFLADVLAVIAVALLVVGAVLLARMLKQQLPIRTQKYARDFVRTNVTFQVGLGFLIASLWADGGDWIVGRIIATLIYLGLLATLLPLDAQGHSRRDRPREDRPRGRGVAPTSGHRPPGARTS